MASNHGFTVWLTGMSGTGKSSLANYIAARLRQVGRNVEVLDEEDVKEALWQDMGDTKEDRVTAVRRVGFVANLLIRPVDEKHHEPDRDTGDAGAGHEVEGSGHGREPSAALLPVAWAIVAIPLAYGVYQTAIKAVDLFG